MEDILHQLRLVVLPTIYKGFIHPKWCRISSINSNSDAVWTSQNQAAKWVTPSWQQYLLGFSYKDTMTQWRISSGQEIQGKVPPDE